MHDVFVCFTNISSSYVHVCTRAGSEDSAIAILENISFGCCKVTAFEYKMRNCFYLLGVSDSANP